MQWALVSWIKCFSSRSRNTFVVYVPMCITTFRNSCAVFKFLEATWCLLSFVCRCFCRKPANVRANSLTLYNCCVDNFSHETNCANWSTNFSTASVSTLSVLLHTWCKLVPCRDFSLCSHPWQYSRSCWRASSSQKICTCVIVMFLKIGTWSVQWSINCCVTALPHSLLVPSLSYKKPDVSYFYQLYKSSGFHSLLFDVIHTLLMTQHCEF